MEDQEWHIDEGEKQNTTNLSLLDVFLKQKGLKIEFLAEL